MTDTTQRTADLVEAKEWADTAVIAAHEFEPECDGRRHARAINGHVPEQAATWLVILPCGQNLFRCSGWVAYMTAAGGTRCVKDGRVHWLVDLSIVPLAGV